MTVISPPTSTDDDAKEGLLELTTGKCVDDWIHHTVTVAQPEHRLEEPRGYATRCGA